MCYYEGNNLFQRHLEYTAILPKSIQNIEKKIRRKTNFLGTGTGTKTSTINSRRLKWHILSLKKKKFSLEEVGGMEGRDEYAVALETKCDIIVAISLRNHCLEGENTAHLLRTGQG